MEKILFRKLLSDYLSFFIITILSAGLVIWVFQAVNFLDIMIEDGRDYLVYIKFSLLNFPKILSKIFPFVLFFSLFYITTKYELQNELIIFWNFGVQKMNLVNFIFKISILLTFLQIFLTSFLVPNSQEAARSLLRSTTINIYDNFVKSKKFNDTVKGLTIYAEKNDGDGKLENLYLKKDINSDEFQITIAKKGEFQEVKNTPILILYNGKTITLKKNQLTNISFSKSDFSLSNIETNTTTYVKTQELSSTKLYNCIKNYFIFDKNLFLEKSFKIENCNILNIDNIFREFYKRFIIPLYIPSLSLLTFLIMIYSKESSYYQKTRLITFSLGTCVIIISETTLKFITNSIVPNLIISLIPVLFLVSVYLFLNLKFKFRL